LTGLSVIMPNFNKAPYLEESVRSVLAQSYSEFELVLVDDASTDASLDVAERLGSEDSRLKLVKHDRKKGVPASFNTGIRASKGDLVTLMGSDDVISRERFQRVVDHLPPVSWPSVIYSDPINIGPETKAVSAAVSKANFRPTGMILDHLLTGDFRFFGVPISAPRKCFDEVGPFDETLMWGEDFDMSLRLAKRYPYVFDPLSTYGYRIYEQNVAKLIDDRTRWSQQGVILERSIVENYPQLDEQTRRMSFRFLFQCFVASGRWGDILRYGLTKEAGFKAMVNLPDEAAKRRKAARQASATR
jgi:glycosyltransferase involved in cell wall biosynthesis